MAKKSWYEVNAASTALCLYLALTISKDFLWNGGYKNASGIVIILSVREKVMVAF